MRILILGNPVAGRGRATSMMAAAGQLLHEMGHEVSVRTPADRRQTRAEAARAVHDGVDAVIACGGDGTVHDVVQSLARTHTALGVLPAGSGDDACSGLGLTTGSVELVVAAIGRDLVAGSPRRVDLGHVITADGAEHFFASVMCSGFDARVNARANGLPRLMGQRYTLAMLRELSTFTPLDYQVSTGDDSFHAEAMILSVGNGARYGGGMRICPAADVSDNLLDVTLLTRVSRPRLLWSFRLVFSGRHVTLPFVKTWRTAVLTVDSAGQTAYADGERLGPLPARITSQPMALRVVGTDPARLLVA